MIYEVPKLNARRRNQLRRQLAAGALRCRFELLSGKRCSNGVIIVRRRKSIDDKGKLMKTRFCRAHTEQAILDRLGLPRFGGKTTTSGLNRGKPRTNPYVVMREMVEEHINEFLKPYIDALQAEKEVVVGNGRSAKVVHVPDHRARLQAAEALYDRVYGKPKQTTMLEGSTDKPLEVNVPQDKDRQMAVASILAAAGAVQVPSKDAVAAVADAVERQN